MNVGDAVNVGEAVNVDDAVAVLVPVTDAVTVTEPLDVPLHDGVADGVDDAGASAITYGIPVDGTDSTSCDPLPNCPTVFEPQHDTAPPSLNAHMKCAPPAMLATLPLMGTIGPGTFRCMTSP